jgi:hypothetical protein
LKFGDVVLAVASFAVVFILIWVVLEQLPINIPMEYQTDQVVSLLGSGLIVGYVFAGKIRGDSRMVSIGKIVVLSAFVMMFLAVMSFAAVAPHYANLVDEGFRNSTSTSSWTNSEWFANSQLALVYNTGTRILDVLLLSFIGLYLGSIRKPSAKTKE